MNNPKIEIDISEILQEIKTDQKKVLEEINNLKIGQSDIRGDIKSLNTKTDQLEKRVGNVEFAVRGVLIGLLIVILGGFAMFFWMGSKL